MNEEFAIIAKLAKLLTANTGCWAAQDNEYSFLNIFTLVVCSPQKLIHKSSPKHFLFNILRDKNQEGSKYCMYFHL